MSDYTGPGIYYLQSVERNTVVNLAGANKADGIKVIGWRVTFIVVSSNRGANIYDRVKAEGDNERWSIAYAGNEEYYLINLATRTYITVSSQSRSR